MSGSSKASHAMKLLSACAVLSVFAPVHARAQTQQRDTWSVAALAEVKFPILDRRNGPWISDLALLPNERIAVALLGEVRFYNSKGEPERVSAGRVGAPIAGHYADQLLLLGGDTLAAIGYEGRVWMDTHGRQLRSAPTPIGVRPRYSFVQRVVRVFTPNSRSNTVDRVLPNGAELTYTYAMEKGNHQFPNGRQYYLRNGKRDVHLVDIPIVTVKGLGKTEDGYMRMAPIPFAPALQRTIGRDRIYVGSSGSNEIHVFDFNGKALPSIKLARSPALVTSAEVVAYKDMLAARMTEREKNNKDPRGNGVPLFRADLDSTTAMQYKPVYGKMLASSNGELWVSDYDPDESHPSHWSVLDANGRQVARITLPPNFTPKRIDNDRVVGVTKENMPDQSVTVLRLSRQVVQKPKIITTAQEE